MLRLAGIFKRVLHAFGGCIDYLVGVEAFAKATAFLPAERSLGGL